MRNNLKTTLFGALCGAVLFTATEPTLAGPLSFGVAQEDSGSTPLVQQASYAHHRHSAQSRKCLEWRTPRGLWRGRYGHRRCVKWS
jgi:hypothetical protein